SKQSEHRGNVGFKPLLQNNDISTSACVVRRSAILSVGGFDARFGGACEDYHLWLRIAASAPIVQVPGVHVHYVREPQSSSRTVAQYERIRNRTLCAV